jgi:hypothetical protein
MPPIVAHTRLRAVLPLVIASLMMGDTPSDQLEEIIWAYYS